MDEETRAARYAHADERVRFFRMLLERSAQDGRMRAFFRYAGALARAMNDRAQAVEEALSPIGDTSTLDLAA